MATPRALCVFFLTVMFAQIVAADNSNVFVTNIMIILSISIVLAFIVFLLTWCNKKTFPWLSEWEYACSETCDCLRGCCPCCCCFKSNPPKKLQEEPYSEDRPDDVVVDNAPKLKAPPEFMQKVVDENFY